ncbi:hypothetical protein K458DRAFT_446687 [Lentithecium fluviatile CBS 122367]|uniref:DDE-1 domain-containing protein n=1 Tax=Lentithecium fluviatile CBS 122367 TaxID=1168545 RepID=A0A6G1IIJ3_9PLEO|nr:hypothetical protein K458DRAFT_446687 [Lentithecium fluviatile CBS 122367]
MKRIHSLAFIIARQRSATTATIKPPGKNWPKAFEKRHPAILSESVYNMDETGVMLCVLGSVKVLTTYPTPGWHYACSESEYTDSKISPKLTSFCVVSPSHTSHKLQPCDIGVFGLLKAAYRDEVERLYRGGANIVSRGHFTSLYSPAREKALTSRNIKAGWIKAGLFPFNPDRVLRDIQKPPAELTVPKADEVNLQDEVLQTPATAEALTLLHGLIEQDTHALDERSKQRLRKFANAAQISFAERTLLADENRCMFKQSNEAKVRRATKSTIVGKAKVMSYEDIEE